VVRISVKKVAQRWMEEPGFKEGYDALYDELSLASQLIEARARSGLTQAQVADRMGTSQSAVARLESGTARPSLSTLKRFAQATGARVRITLESKGKAKRHRDKRAA
jgi:transcriptional regulator with XRE-family HTH domain